MAEQTEFCSRCQMTVEVPSQHNRHAPPVQVQLSGVTEETVNTIRAWFQESRERGARWQQVQARRGS